MAGTINKKFNFPANSLIVDIGSNDGILLRPFKKLGVRVLGIDPARKIAKEASKNGLETLPEYFDQKLADYIIKKYGFADVICANNVFAHVPLIDELVLAIKRLLKPEGILVIEAPYLVDFIQKNLFDTIYHEHVSYLSIKPLGTLFKRFEMDIFDVQKTDSRGIFERVLRSFLLNVFTMVNNKSFNPSGNCRISFFGLAAVVPFQYFLTDQI